MTALRRAMPRVSLYAMAIVPFVVAAVRAVARGWFPIGDAAQLYIRATDVLTPHHPWIGSGSSASASLGFQVNNAGPLYYDLIAPFARTLPPGPGAVFGVTAVNVACLTLAGIAARRIGGEHHGRVFEAWVLAGAAVLAWTMGSELLFDMFQAHALLFPFLAACVLLTGAAVGQRWVWPWLAFVLSLIVQTHVSYAYILPMLVIAATAAAIAGLPAPRLAAVRALGRAAAVRRTAAWSGGVLALAWLQPVWEQLFGPGQGNLTRLARAAGGTDVTLGLGNAVRLMAAFVALPPWSGRHGFRNTIEPSGITVGPDGQEVVTLAGMPPGWVAGLALVVTVGLLAGAWWHAQRRAIAALRALATLALTGVVGGIVALSRLTVTVLGFAPHHTRWIIVVALLVYITLAWALVDAIGRRWSGNRLASRRARRGLDTGAERPTRPAVAAGARPRPAGAAVLVAAGVVVLVTLLNLPRYAQPHGPTADEAARPALQAAFDELDAATFDDPVYFDLVNERVYAPHTSALQLHLRDRGIEFRVDSEFLVRHLGEGRRAHGDEPTVLFQYHDAEGETPPDTGCVTVRIPPTGTAPGWPAMWFAVVLSGPGACQ